MKQGPRWRVELVANRQLRESLHPFLLRNDLQDETWVPELLELFTGQEQANVVLIFLGEHVRHPRCTVVAEASMFVLVSTDFDTLTDALQVRDLAADLVWVLNGLIQLGFARLFANLSVGRVIELRPTGEEMEHPFEEQPTPPHLPLDPVSLADSNAVELWLAAALKDSKIAEALHHYADDGNWFNLYKVYELIKADVGDNGIAVWKGQANLNAFRGSANAARIDSTRIRHDARHSTEGSGANKAPKRQMSLAEAQTYVLSILLEWLRTK